VGACFAVVLRLTDSGDSRLAPYAAAGVAALSLAFSPTFWSQATEAEVYALNSLFVIVLVGLALRLRAEPGYGKAWLLFASVLGLALTHHRMIVLLLPALLGLLLFNWRKLISGPALARQRTKLAVALLAPLLLYLYTPLRYDATPYTHVVLDAQHVITTLDDTPAAFVAHVLGTGFSGALYWDDTSIQRLGTTPGRVVAEFGLPGVLLALLGTWLSVRRRQWPLLVLSFGVMLAFTLFNALYHIGDIGDFYAPVYIMIAVLIGQGVRALGRVHAGLALTCLLLPLALLYQVLPAMEQHEDVRAEWYVLLGSHPPEGAVLISNDRDEMTPLYYLELVEGRRPDLLGLFPLISADAHVRNVVALTQYAFETTRPIYYIKPMEGLSLKFRLQTDGPFQRVLGAQDTTPQHTLRREAALLNFAGWTREDDRRLSTEDGKAALLRVALIWQATSSPRSDLKTYVHVMDAKGSTIAQSDHVPGGAYYPPSVWAAGEMLYDMHAVALPNGLASGDYQLIAGAYLPDGRAIDGLSSIDLGAVRIAP
jgi:hypothetical protein